MPGWAKTPLALGRAMGRAATYDAVVRGAESSTMATLVSLSPKRHAAGTYILAVEEADALNYRAAVFAFQHLAARAGVEAREVLGPIRLGANQ